MKTFKLNLHILFSLLFMVVIGLSSCCTEDIGDDCIDEEEICETCPCTREYNPVCGCDEVTYGNSCEAETSGVKEYTEGECPN